MGTDVITQLPGLIPHPRFGGVPEVFEDAFGGYVLFHSYVL
jgi:hypothetical protein